MTFRIGTPHTHGAGYYINDKELKTRQEADVQTCSHCQTIILMQQWMLEGAFCRTCMHPICFNCGTRLQTYGCENFMRQIEREFDQLQKIDRFLKLAGLESTPHAPTQQIYLG